MKKLLLTLSSFCLTTTSSTTLIACGTSEKANKFKNAAISDKIAQEVVAEISNDSKYGKMTGKQIFADASLIDYVVKLINKYTAEHFFVAEERNRAITLGVEKSKFDETKTKEKFNSWVDEIAETKLLQDYIKGINDFSYLEYQIVKKGYEVNFQTSDWQVSGIISSQLTNTTDSLTTDNKTDEINSKGTKGTSIKTDIEGFTKLIFPVGATADVAAKKLEWAKKALKERFKSYYKQEVLPEVYNKIITTTYLRSTQFLSSSKKEVMLNKNKDFFSNMQTWDKNTSISPWKSNIKMVWELKVKEGVAIDKNDLENTNFPDSTKDSPALIDKIKKVFNGNTDKNEVKDGVDPIWQIQGFKGFVAHDKNGGIYSKNTIDDASVYKKLLSKTNATGFLKNGSLDYFLDSDKGFKTYLFVLPIYAVDLMTNFKLNATDTDGTKKEKPISFSFKQGGNDDSIGRDLSNEWALQGRINHSTLIEKASQEIKEKLVQWIEYTIADQGILQTSAKTKYYSSIFQNSKDNIYSADLETAIGQFIV